MSPGSAQENRYLGLNAVFYSELIWCDWDALQHMRRSCRAGGSVGDLCSFGAAVGSQEQYHRTRQMQLMQMCQPVNLIPTFYVLLHHAY